MGPWKFVVDMGVQATEIKHDARSGYKWGQFRDVFSIFDKILVC